MAYTPDLIIDIAALKEKKKEIHLLEFSDNENTAFAAHELSQEIKIDKPVKFKGMEFVITGFNLSFQCTAAREILDELGIEYTTSY